MPLFPLILALAFFFGLIIGSFLNVIIHRGPVIWKLVERNSDEKSYSFAAPRSHCPHCRTQIKNIHLMPLMGYLLLRGKCAACSQPIAWRYPVVELATGLAAVLILALAGISFHAAALFVFACFLITLTFIDLETTFLPDALTYPFLLIGLVANAFGLFIPVTSSVIGSIAGFLIFWLIGEAFYRLRGTDGLGMGDAKLLAGIGAWLGWIALPFVVLISSIVGLFALMCLQVIGKEELTRDTAIPFGPFLSVAAIVIMILHLSGLPILH